jgi:ATP-dependent Zn protease
MRKILAIFVVLAIAGLASGSDGAAEPEYLSYEEFLEKVQADEVESLTMGPWGYLKGSSPEGQVEKEFYSQRPLESASDPLLTELLAKHQVKVVQEPLTEHSAMSQLAQYGPFILLLPLPTVLGVIVLVYLVRLNNKINQVIIR